MKETSEYSDTTSSKTRPTTPAITYKLSDELFKTLGWTYQPETAITIPVVTMKAKFAHEVICPWFIERNEKATKRYKNGKTLYVAYEDGTGCIYYPNGKIAIRIRKTGKRNQITRVVVKTAGDVEPDGIRRSSQLCAVFDSLGNGVVYDCNKRKRLVFDQNHGIACLKPKGIPIYWKWHNMPYSGSMTIMNEAENFSKKDKTLVRANDVSSSVVGTKKESMSDLTSTKSTSCSPIAFTTTSPLWDSSEIGFSEAVEQRHYINTSKIHPKSSIKPIIFQINTYIGMRILSQAEVSLSFFALGEQTRLNIGILYNPYDKFTVEKVRAHNADEKVPCPFEVLQGKGRSKEILKKLIQKEKSSPCLNMS